MSSIREVAWCRIYNLDCIKADVYNGTKKFISVWKSYKIKSAKHMREVLYWMKGYPEYAEVMKLPMWLLVAEWKTHNLLYNWGYERERTQNLEIEPTMDWKYKVGYAILSLFYWG